MTSPPFAEYRRDGPPLPREDRDRDRYAAPAPRRGDRGFDGKRRQHSPPQRNRRERDEDEEREALQTQKEAEQQQADDTADGDEEQEMMKAMGFGGFGTTKVSHGELFRLYSAAHTIYGHAIIGEQSAG